LLIVSAALSGVCGYLSADASNLAADANDASIKDQNEALNIYNVANQQIQNDRNIISEADVHWFNADTNRISAEFAYYDMQLKYTDYLAKWTLYENSYLASNATDEQMYLLYFAQSSWQEYSDLYSIYNNSFYWMWNEYGQTEWLIETTEAFNNGNISYELYNDTSDAGIATFWVTFEKYENWTYQPYNAKISDSEKNATMSQQFDQDAKTYLLSTVMLGISATIAAIALSVEYRTSRKYLIVVTAIIAALAAIFALMTVM